MRAVATWSGLYYTARLVAGYAPPLCLSTLEPARGTRLLHPAILPQAFLPEVQLNLHWKPAVSCLLRVWDHNAVGRRRPSRVVSTVKQSSCQNPGVIEGLHCCMRCLCVHKWFVSVHRSSHLLKKSVWIAASADLVPFLGNGKLFATLVKGQMVCSPKATSQWGPAKASTALQGHPAECVSASEPRAPLTTANPCTPTRNVASSMVQAACQTKFTKSLC